MKNKIDKLREHLHQVVQSNDNAGVLKVSRELDELIVEYYKKQNFAEEDGE